MNLNCSRDSVKIIGCGDLPPKFAFRAELPVQVEQLVPLSPSFRILGWRLVTSVRNPKLGKILVGVDSAGPDYHSFDFRHGDETAEHHVACHAMSPKSYSVRVHKLCLLQCREGVQCIDDVVPGIIGAPRFTFRLIVTSQVDLENDQSLAGEEVNVGGVVDQLPVLTGRDIAVDED